MTQKEFFGKSVWLTAKDLPECEVEKGGASHFPILRSEIEIEDHKINGARLRVVGLGYFYCFVNGKRVSDDEYMPLYSDFEPRENYPPEEKLSGHRIYVPEYDVKDLLLPGKNSIVIFCGGGFYTHGYRPEEVYGDAKAIFSLTLDTDMGTVNYYSSPENTKAQATSFIKKYHFERYEHQDLSDFDFGIFDREFDSSRLENAAAARPLSEETVYDMIDCPTDKVIRRIIPKKTAENDGIVTYDGGENITGYPLFRITAPKGERVKVVFSEDINGDGTINEKFTQMQSFEVISDGKGRIVRPAFIWYGFRCFSVEGMAEPVEIRVVHSNVDVTSSFECDDDTLNWLYKAFINTQLCNMHGGIPSDCPHLERRGYTGDGQLVCHTAMMTLDAREFYRKWLRDIADCQDKLSGHVQYTAPYSRRGGGPGGWGSAIVEVPYRYYLHYGEVSVLKSFYPAMLKYIEYLESRSENDLVVRSQQNIWCLGDWATPASVVMPAPYVNNYFYVKSLEKMIEIARLIKCDDDIPGFLEIIERKKRAMTNAYFNTWDGNFLGNLQGANAFAVDIGLGDDRTYKNMVEHYRKTRCYDTGIFGTELVTRLLFERGDDDVAIDLLTSRKEIHTFDAMRQRGATTVWEYFPGSLRDRSHSHPMFGAVVGCLFEYILGIKCGVNGESVTVSPKLNNKLTRASGTIEVKNGKISVSYSKDAEGRCAEFAVEIPEKVEAEFVYNERILPLHSGRNSILIEI